MQYLNHCDCWPFVGFVFLVNPQAAISSFIFCLSRGRLNRDERYDAILVCVFPSSVCLDRLQIPIESVIKVSGMLFIGDAWFEVSSLDIFSSR